MLKSLCTFDERYQYLKLTDVVGSETFGHNRYINQALYRSRRWKRARDIVIQRDRGCDLGVDGFEIYDSIVVHHMNPISLEDIENGEDHIFDPNFLISTTKSTHSAIHFGDDNKLSRLPVERTRNDTIPWRT